MKKVNAMTWVIGCIGLVIFVLMLIVLGNGGYPILERILYALGVVFLYGLFVGGIGLYIRTTLKRQGYYKKAVALRTQGHLDEALHFFLKSEESWDLGSLWRVRSRAVTALKQLVQVMEQIAQIVKEKGEHVDAVDRMSDKVNSLLIIYTDDNNFSSFNGKFKKEVVKSVKSLEYDLKTLHSGLRKALNMEDFQPRQKER